MKMTWFHRIYASQVKEEIPYGFQSHVLVMRMTGVWPTATDPSWYKWLTAVYFVMVGISLPLLVFSNIFVASTIEEAMDHIFTSLSFWMVAFKSGFIYGHRNSIREMFRTHARLLTGAEHHVDVARSNIRMHVYFYSLYLLSWCSVLLQALFSTPEERFWRSTANWPYAFARNRIVYITVLVYQATCNMGLIIWASMEDSFYIALINTVCSHVTLLKKRLRALDTKDGVAVRDARFYAELIECCARYEQCLR